ncbi:YraN family protein [Emcibacter sp.]|uniref:YraN family protein n=1 Tax=Emcibacter sp. TaxID=1979954 RepID=UPI002AA791DC|nr:YraN family protein [Emcibacter sp.]
MAGAHKRKAYFKGILAEYVAIAYVRLKGYRIRERRFKCAFGEIDVIAQKADLIVFIEVKIRKTLEEAASSILRPQQLRITRAANWYISRRLANDLARQLDYSFRFDTILLVPWKWPCHIQDAWQEES